MKVAITGGSGHIGNCLVRELKKQGALSRPLEETLIDTFTWYEENKYLI